MDEIPITAQSLDRYVPIVGEAEVRDVKALAEAASERLQGRVVWNINSTARGGGVAEMLHSLLPYVRGAGIDIRWLVLSGTPEFFAVTKRLHHALHGSRGGATQLSESARRTYEALLRRELRTLESQLRPGDIVLLHDPQTAGLVPDVVSCGARTIWRCHIGGDTLNAEVERGWRFLERYVEQAHATVFTRDAYIPDCCDGDRSVVIQPSIDPFSPKNQDMDSDSVRSILVASGLVDGTAAASAVFRRADGSPGRIERQAHMEVTGALPTFDDRLVLQVSRWDSLKDPVGVMRGFAALSEGPAVSGVHLILAGPDPRSVSDDPEGRDVIEQVRAAWSALSDATRARIHPVSLPMVDIEENAAMVNALQRHAAVVVQKSLSEGFGLTVTEAMAKGRPILASAVGGIVDQIEDGVHGRLLADPADEQQFARLLTGMLQDADSAEAMGSRARERATRRYLGLRSLRQYAQLFARIDATD